MPIASGYSNSLTLAHFGCRYCLTIAVLRIVTIDQLQPSPHDEASAAQFWEIQTRPDGASQSPPPELALYTGTQEPEPPGEHGFVSDGKQYYCDRCEHTFKRLQEPERHVREVHSGLPPQCPLCPYQWKRPYRIKDHLIEVHKNELIRVVEGIRILRGKDVVKFVETLGIPTKFRDTRDKCIVSSFPCL
jgi:hypothetical protein